jgi:hypothetical protein
MGDDNDRWRLPRESRWRRFKRRYGFTVLVLVVAVLVGAALSRLG